jgi:hypothetical protein
MKPNNFQKLIASLKFKKQRNTSYFMVMENFKVSNVDFTIHKGAILLFSGVPAETDSELYLSVIYKVKPLNSDISIVDAGEGLIKMKYDDLAGLLISKRIIAYYTDLDSKDKEIDKLVQNYLTR